MRAADSGSASATFISTPTRRIGSRCCARAASGHATAPPSSVISSRRRISTPCLGDGILAVQMRTLIGTKPASKPLRSAPPMSQLGQTRRLDRGPATSGLPRTTDFIRPARWSGWCQERKSHSITSSAVAISAAGTSRPSALAVLRLMTNSKLVGCSTGMSPGFVPRRILSTKSAVRRNRAGKLGP
jgi:hypothetical protein